MFTPDLTRLLRKTLILCSLVVLFSLTHPSEALAECYDWNNCMDGCSNAYYDCRNQATTPEEQDWCDAFWFACADYCFNHICQ